MNNFPQTNEQVWMINSECAQIYVLSQFLNMESCCSHLKIADQKYTGSEIINTVIDRPSFSAVFTPNENVGSVEFLINWFCYSYSQRGTAGILWLGVYDSNEEIEWSINSECAAIQIESTRFNTESDADFLSIGNKKYSGSAIIDQIIDGASFVAKFTSDSRKSASGFTVYWSCYSGVIEHQNGINFDSPKRRW